jgi:hypothetical protein
MSLNTTKGKYRHGWKYVSRLVMLEGIKVGHAGRNQTCWPGAHRRHRKAAIGGCTHDHMSEAETKQTKQWKSNLFVDNAGLQSLDNHGSCFIKLLLSKHLHDRF